MLEAIFSSHDDEVIADGVCMWVAGGSRTLAGSYSPYLAKRAKRDKPFSPRLRVMSIYAIERIRYGELGVSDLETVRLLNHLNVDVGDMGEGHDWPGFLMDVVHSPAGFESLSTHYWYLLYWLSLAWDPPVRFESRDMGLVTSLEEAEQWEKLEVWVAIAWQSLSHWYLSRALATNIEEATLRLLLRQPSAFPRFEHLSDSGALRSITSTELRRICAEARAEQLTLEPPLL